MPLGHVLAVQPGVVPVYGLIGAQGTCSRSYSEMYGEENSATGPVVSLPSPNWRYRTSGTRTGRSTSAVIFSRTIRLLGPGDGGGGSPSFRAL